MPSASRGRHLVVGDLHAGKVGGLVEFGVDGQPGAGTAVPHRKNLDRHPTYILAAYMASGT